MRKALIGMVSALMVVTTACSSSNTVQTNKPAATSGSEADKKTGNVELTFWTTSKDNYQEEIKAFEAKNPNIKVKATFMGNYDEMAQKVQAAAVANTLPNVVQLGQRHAIPQIADSGKLIPIEKFMSKEEISDVQPALWDRFRYKGQLWTIPFSSSTPVLYYNKNLFKDAGLNAPDTWDELVTDAQKLTKDTNNDGRPDVWGFNTAEDTPWYLQPLTWDRNGVIVGSDGKVTVNSKQMVDTLKSFQDLVYVQKAMAPNQHKTAEQDFTAGKVAMLFSSGSALAGYKKQVGDKFDIGVVYLPKVEQRQVPIGGNSLGIFKSNQEQEEASWKFVSFMTNTENAAKLSMDTGYIPIKKSAMELDAFKQHIAKDPSFKVTIDQMQFLKGQAMNPTDNLVWKGLVEALDKVEADPKADPQKLLDQLQQDVNQFLTDYTKKN